MAFIKFNGKRSDELGIRLLNDVEHEISTNDVAVTQVLGVDGDLIMNNKRLNSVQKQFPIRLYADRGDRNITVVSEDISDWLDIAGWEDLELSWDSAYVYRAMPDNLVSIAEILRQIGTARLSFRVYPLKFLKAGLQEVAVSNNQNLLNLGRRESKPKLIIRGNGNIKIRINGRLTEFRNVQGGIDIDSLNRTVSYDTNAQWDKFVRHSNDDWPRLDIGQNNIQIEGNGTLRIVPNWVVKL